VTLPLLIGLISAGAVIATLRLTGMDRDRASAPIVLIAIALFWPVFAVENGEAWDITVHGAFAVAFAVAAIWGHRRDPAVVGWALVAHGAFDAGVEVLADGPAPPWWAPFCAAFDVVVGLWVVLAAPRGRRDDPGAAP
jgi:hypothetical protein